MLCFAFVTICMFIANCEGTGYPINLPLSAIFDRLEKNELHMLTDEMAKDHKFLVFLSRSCPYCRNTTKMLDTKYPDLSYDYYEYDTQPGGLWLIYDIMKRNGASVLPQVYICQQYVGGWYQMDQLDKSNQLESKVKSC